MARPGHQSAAAHVRHSASGLFPPYLWVGGRSGLAGNHACEARCTERPPEKPAGVHVGSGGNLPPAPIAGAALPQKPWQQQQPVP